MPEDTANGNHADDRPPPTITDATEAGVMGHRALVASERVATDDTRYDLYYSHWGGADLSLARELGSGLQPDASQDAPQERRERAGKPWTHPQVDPDPLATGVAWDDLLASHLDPLVHEALFVLPVKGDVRAYRPYPAGQLDCPAVVVAVNPGDPCDDTRVRGLVVGARAALTTAFEANHLDAAAAGAALRDTLTARFSHREVVWLD